MTLIVNRVDLWNSFSKRNPNSSKDVKGPSFHNNNNHNNHNNQEIAPYRFGPDANECLDGFHKPQCTVAIRLPPKWAYEKRHPEELVFDHRVPNPLPSHVVHDKYWAQRKGLFTRFDQGIQLDPEGWYSVTPEVIAEHVADRAAEIITHLFKHDITRMKQSETKRGIIILDAFCGCGGNTIAFSKLRSSLVAHVICVDIDRTKLRKAAHNAAIYDIPREKLLFVESNSLYVLQNCYRDGRLIRTAAEIAKPADREMCEGFMIGGCDLLPGHIDAVFMDPPWGGVDYGKVGKEGYHLEKHMKIRVGENRKEDELRSSKVLNSEDLEMDVFQDAVENQDSSSSNNNVDDSFFDAFGGGGGGGGSESSVTLYSNYSKDILLDELNGEFINGVDLLTLAAFATKDRIVIYDLPRNTNKKSLAEAAFVAGYRGNIKLEEHFLNGRFKTVTLYLGRNFTNLLT